MLISPFNPTANACQCNALGGNLMASAQMAMMTALMGMMMQLMHQFGLAFQGQGNMGSLLPNQANFGGGGPISGAGLSDFLGGTAASSGPAAGGSGGPQASSEPASDAPPQVGGADASGGTGSTNAPAGSTSIGSGSRILEIGDSHTVGTFGHDLDSRLRGTGAQVSTYASAGANPSDFVRGTGHRFGYWEKRADGTERNVRYGTNAAPPSLETLIQRERPTMILVNLGANFRGGNPRAEIDRIGQIAQRHNIPLVWVGPPKNSSDNRNPGSIQRFDQQMAAAVAPYGRYIASIGFTPRYSGSDGTHYSGAEGNRTARQWASGVFNAVTGSRG